MLTVHGVSKSVMFQSKSLTTFGNKEYPGSITITISTIDQGLVKLSSTLQRNKANLHITAMGSYYDDDIYSFILAHMSEIHTASSTIAAVNPTQFILCIGFEDMNPTLISVLKKQQTDENLGKMFFTKQIEDLIVIFFDASAPF